MDRIRLSLALSFICCSPALVQAQSADPDCLDAPTSGCVLAMADAGFARMHPSIKKFDHVVQNYAAALMWAGREDEARALMNAMENDYSKHAVRGVEPAKLAMAGDFEAAMALRNPEGDPLRRAFVLTLWAGNDNLDLEEAERDAFVQEALALWDARDEETGQVTGDYYRVLQLGKLGDFAKALQVADAIEEFGLRFQAFFTLAELGRRAGHEATLKALGDRIESMRAQADERDMRQVIDLEARLLGLGGDLEGAIAMAETAEESYGTQGILRGLAELLGAQNDAESIETLADRFPAGAAQALLFQRCYHAAAAAGHEALAGSCRERSSRIVRTILFLRGPLDDPGPDLYRAVQQQAILEALEGNWLLSDKIAHGFSDEQSRILITRRVIDRLLARGDYALALKQAMRLSAVADRPEALALIALRMAEAGH